MAVAYKVFTNYKIKIRGSKKENKKGGKIRGNKKENKKGGKFNREGNGYMNTYIVFQSKNDVEKEQQEPHHQIISHCS